MTDGIETTTWHDQRPSHPPVPADIAAMQTRYDELCAEYDGLIERYYHDQCGEVAWEAIEKAATHLNMCEHALYHLRDLMHGGDCTCTPVSVMCEFCLHERRYKEFLELEKGINHENSD